MSRNVKNALISKKDLILKSLFLRVNVTCYCSTDNYLTDLSLTSIGFSSMAKISMSSYLSFSSSWMFKLINGNLSNLENGSSSYLFSFICSTITFIASIMFLCMSGISSALSISLKPCPWIIWKFSKRTNFLRCHSHLHLTNESRFPRPIST